MGLLIGITRRFARRSRWLARRLWLITAAEVALLSLRHWRRLEPEERRRLRELVWKSKLRPKKNLTARERREASELFDKLGPDELAGSAARAFVPLPLVDKSTGYAVRRARR